MFRVWQYGFAGVVFLWSILTIVPAGSAADSTNGTYAGSCRMSYSKGGSDKTPKIRFTIKGNTVESASYAEFKGGGGTVTDGVAQFSVSDNKNNTRVFSLDLAKGVGTARGIGSANVQSGECQFARTKR